MDTLPENATLMASPDVWMEGDALEQLARVARFPGCRKAVGMPDLHPGPGIPSARPSPSTASSGRTSSAETPAAA